MSFTRGCSPGRLGRTGRGRREQTGGRRHGRSLGTLGDEPGRWLYGLRKGYRGRFAMYLPPLLEALGLAEVTHDARNNKCAPSKRFGAEPTSS